MNPKKEEEQERLRSLLVDTVILLCKSGLTYQNIRVQGLLGITVNDKDLFLVPFNEFHQKQEFTTYERTTSTECQDLPCAQPPKVQTDQQGTSVSSGNQQQTAYTYLGPRAPAVKQELVSGTAPEPSAQGKSSELTLQRPATRSNHPQDRSPAPNNTGRVERDCGEAMSEGGDLGKSNTENGSNDYQNVTREQTPEKCPSESRDEASDKDDLSAQTVLLRKLSAEISNPRLRYFFEMNGLPVNEIRRSTASFGSVVLQSASHVTKALTFDGTMIDGNRLTIDTAHSEPTATDDARILFVGNLSFDTDCESLKAAFAGCIGVKIPKQETGKSKRYGFVHFANKESAQKACNTMNGRPLQGRHLWVEFSKQPDQARSWLGPVRCYRCNEMGHYAKVCIKGASGDPAAGVKRDSEEVHTLPLKQDNQEAD